MPTKKKKRASVAADDTLRALITSRIRAIDEDMPAEDRAELVDAIAGVFGDKLVGIIDGAIGILTYDEDADDDDDGNGDE